MWYQTASKRTLNHDYSTIKPEEVELLSLSAGACGEAGELYNKLKKGIIHQHGINIEEVAEEIGDVLWYLTGLATKLGLDMEDIMLYNVDKSKKRYPEGFDTEKSKNREE